IIGAFPDPTAPHQDVVSGAARRLRRYLRNPAVLARLAGEAAGFRQDLLELVAGTIEPGLDGAYGAAANLGRLLVAQARCGDEHQNLAMLDRHALARVGDL